MKLSQIDFNTQTLTDEQAERLVFGQVYETVTPCDFAVVLGTDAVRAQKRAKMAADFYHQGGAPRLIVTGGPLQEIDGKKLPECEIMRQTLLTCGVPDSAIIMENRARNTAENMIFSYSEAVAHSPNDFGIKSFTVITEPSHIWRSVILAKIFFPSFVQVYGYTQGTEEARRAFRTDKRLHTNVLNEPRWLADHVVRGRWEDIELD